MQTAY